MTARGTLRASLSLLLATVLGACSTYELRVNAEAGAGMNPSQNGAASTVCVYVFFLKKTDAFLAKDKRADFLPACVIDEGRLPPFLEADAAKLEPDAPSVLRVEIPPLADGKPAVPIVKKITVPKEVTHVGLVAAFQTHRDNDPDEVWRLPLEVKGSTVSFEVVGRRLAESTPKKKEKEASRAKSSDG
ncbi:MAG: type VI secretion lipoprotein TssJ [Planctomycetes bacterium]|nr:type VI secretion lipoprotein TssJ [Planctomycetota bacterium]